MVNFDVNVSQNSGIVGRVKVTRKPRKRRHVPHSERTPDYVKHRNTRERNRVKRINEAFEILRNRVPNVTTEDSLSKVDILSCAIRYIHHLGCTLSSKKYQNSLPTQSGNGIQTQTENRMPTQSGNGIQTQTENRMPAQSGNGIQTQTENRMPTQSGNGIQTQTENRMPTQSDNRIFTQPDNGMLTQPDKIDPSISYPVNHDRINGNWKESTHNVQMLSGQSSFFNMEIGINTQNGFEEPRYMEIADQCVAQLIPPSFDNNQSSTYALIDNQRFQPTMFSYTNNQQYLSWNPEVLGTGYY